MQMLHFLIVIILLRSWFDVAYDIHLVEIQQQQYSDSRVFVDVVVVVISIMIVITITITINITTTTTTTTTTIITIIVTNGGVKSAQTPPCDILFFSVCLESPENQVTQTPFRIKRKN